MNINYLPMPRLPDFDNYGSIFASIQKGDGFITTGNSSALRESDARGRSRRTRRCEDFHPLSPYALIA